MRELKFICETWKDVPGYENRYRASNLGQVKRINRTTCRGKPLESKILTQRINHKGYFTVRLNLSDKSISISTHRLVALAFISNPDNLPQVNHIDGIKIHNFPDNLEWMTNSGNQLHAYRTGLRKLPVGELNANTSLTSQEVSQIIEEYNSGKMLPEIAKERNINLSIIRNIIYGRSWTDEGKAILKRDDRKVWTSKRVKESIISKYKNKEKSNMIVVAQLTKEGNEVARFRSIKQAADITGIPKVSISSVVNDVKFYNKDKTKYYTMKDAGGYMWQRLTLTVKQLEEIL